MLKRYLKGLATLATALAAAGCQSSQGTSNAAVSAGSVRVVNVEVTPVTTDRFTDLLRITGEVAALHDVTLSAEEVGRIAAFPVDKGATVRQGQVIVELDDAVLRAQVAEARATADLAQEQFTRQRQLWEDEKIGSEITYLQAKANAEAARARLTTLEARLERTKVRSPVDGVFDEKFAEAGEMAMPGTRLARVVATQRVKVTGGVPERDALAVRPGDAATVTFDVLSGQVFQGRISYVGASVDPQNRTVPIEVVMDNPGGRIKPSMVANVEVARAHLADVIVVPQQVVLRTEDGFEAFVVVDENGVSTARSRRLTLGPSQGNRVVVQDGLVPGDRLITLGQQMVDDGGRVRVVTGAAGADSSAPAGRGPGS